jgi:hypothetical protein
MKIVEYLAVDGASPFRNWFDRLDSRAAAKVTTALIRMGMGNTSNVASVGAGFMREKSITAPATVSISAWMARRWSFWLGAAQRSAK